MFGAFIKEAQGYLSKAALVAAFFPALLFWLVVAILLCQATLGITAAIAIWEKQSSIWHYGLITSFLIGVTLSSILISSVHPSIVSWLCGYWPDSAFWRGLARRMRARWLDELKLLEARDHAAQQKQLAADAAAGSTGAGAASPATSADRTPEQERDRIAYQMFRHFPAAPSQIMPTELGNILRTAEQYPNQRYGFDGVLIWTRLQALLPKEFAEGMEALQTSLFLLCTLSCLAIFLIPVLIDMGTYLSPHALPGPTLLSIGAITVMAWLFSVRSLWLRLLFLLTCVAIIVGLAFFPSLHRVSRGALWSLLFVGGALTMARIFYGIALHSALSYGDKLRAAFDMYRFKLLEQLQVRTPTNLVDERRVWKEVCDLLYRSYDPNENYYQYTRGAQNRDRMITAPVPTRMISAHATITKDDVTNIDVFESLVTADIVCDQDKLIGQTAQRTLVPGRPVSAGSLYTFGTPAGRHTIGISVSSAAVLGINLRAGDVIKIMLMGSAPSPAPKSTPGTTTGQSPAASPALPAQPAPSPSPPKPIEFSNVLVADVSRGGESSDKAPASYVVAFAFEPAELLDFVSALPGAAIHLVRTP